MNNSQSSVGKLQTVPMSGWTLNNHGKARKHSFTFFSGLFLFNPKICASPDLPSFYSQWFGSLLSSRVFGSLVSCFFGGPHTSSSFFKVWAYSLPGQVVETSSTEWEQLNLSQPHWEFESVCKIKYVSVMANIRRGGRGTEKPSREMWRAPWGSLFFLFWIKIPTWGRPFLNLSDILTLTDTQTIFTSERSFDNSPASPRVSSPSVPAAAPAVTRHLVSVGVDLRVLLPEMSQTSHLLTVCYRHGRPWRGVGTSQRAWPRLIPGQRATTGMLTCHRYAYCVVEIAGAFLCVIHIV